MHGLCFQPAASQSAFFLPASLINHPAIVLFSLREIYPAEQALSIIYFLFLTKQLYSGKSLIIRQTFFPPSDNARCWLFVIKIGIFTLFHCF